jgi:hypothetical protein
MNDAFIPSITLRFNDLSCATQGFEACSVILQFAIHNPQSEPWLTSTLSAGIIVSLYFLLQLRSSRFPQNESGKPKLMESQLRGLSLIAIAQK